MPGRSGLTVTATHPNRTVLDVAAPAAQAERAFGLHLLVYQSREDGRYFYAPDAEPRIAAALAGVVSGVVGLDNAAQWRPHLRVRRPPPAGLSPLLDPYVAAAVRPAPAGRRPDAERHQDRLQPERRHRRPAAGQTLALFELDGYKASDITAYESQVRPARRPARRTSWWTATPARRAAARAK